MSKIDEQIRQQEILNRLQQLPTPEWIRSMQDYYRQHGHYRPWDVRRLLGDPNQSVTVSSISDLASLRIEMSQKRS